jgi:hypothetical protein
MRVDLRTFRDAAGLGVAGNLAGHLEQAGEAGDFAGVGAPPEAPKGIFPWHLPGTDGPLAGFPLSATELRRPAGDVRLQLEPEVAVVCDLAYDGDGAVVEVLPRAIGAFDDCSIRREGARKISEKKHWGPASKGLADELLEVDDLSREGPCAALRLACFLRRGDAMEAYGVDTPLTGYSFFGDELLAWLVDRLREQRDAGPLEDVGALLRDAGRPGRAVVGIGATRYTDLGASTWLEVGDEAVVVVYDGEATPPGALAERLAAGSPVPGASVLRRQVVAAEA